MVRLKARMQNAEPGSLGAINNQFRRYSVSTRKSQIYI